MSSVWAGTWMSRSEGVHPAPRSGFNVQQLFEFIDSVGNNGDENKPPPEAFSFEQWPLIKEWNCPELLALKAMYRIVPLPACDLAIQFSLWHWATAGGKRDVYGGEMGSIRLLEVPFGSSSLNRKKKVALHLGTDDVPSKKPTTA